MGLATLFALNSYAVTWNYDYAKGGLGNITWSATLGDTATEGSWYYLNDSSEKVYMKGSYSNSDSFVFGDGLQTGNLLLSLDADLTCANIGFFNANAFGVFDMIGNVHEWTNDDYIDTSSKTSSNAKTVRGGSWNDRAKDSRVTVRNSYQAWRKIYNVGFRLIRPNADEAAKILKAAKPVAKRTTPPNAAFRDKYSNNSIQ